MVSYENLGALLAPANAVATRFLKDYSDKMYEKSTVTDIFEQIPITISPAMMDTARKDNPEVTEKQIRDIAIGKLAPLFNKNSAQSFAQNVLGGSNSINIGNTSTGGQSLGGGLFVSLATKQIPTSDQGRDTMVFDSWIAEANKLRSTQTGMTETKSLRTTFDRLPPSKKIAIESFGRKGYATSQALRGELAVNLGLLQVVRESTFGNQWIPARNSLYNSFAENNPVIKNMQGQEGALVSFILNSAEVQGAYVRHLARTVSGDPDAIEFQERGEDRGKKASNRIVDLTNGQVYNKWHPRNIYEEPPEISPEVSTDIIDKLNNISVEKLRTLTTNKNESSDVVLTRLSQYFVNQWELDNPEMQEFIYNMLRSKLYGE